MTLDELQTGMMVKRADDDMAIVFRNSVTGKDLLSGDTWCNLDSYNDDLTYQSIPEATIIEVVAPTTNAGHQLSRYDDAKVIWTRPVDTSPDDAGGFSL